MTNIFFAETFCHNPQYRITLESPDDDDDKCTVIIALMQKNRRAQRRMGADCLTIGFAIYHVCKIDPNFHYNRIIIQLI